MPKKYQSVPLVRGHDSTPYLYKAEDSDDVLFFHKEYPLKDYYGAPVTREGIEIYHQIHTILSQQEYTAEMHPAFTLAGEKYKGVEWTTVPLDSEGVFEASKVDSREPILVTCPPYVAGKTLDQFDNDFEYDDCIGRVCTYWRIEHKMEEEIRTKLKEKIAEDIRFNLIGGFNIKVVKTGGDYLGLVVTDIANQLFSSFLWENEQIGAILGGR